MINPENDPAQHQARFMSLFQQHQAAVRHYIRPYVRRSEDVDEVMQNVSLVAWSKYFTLTDDHSFGGWLCQIAKFEVKNYRRRRARDRFVLNDDVFELLSEEPHESAFQEDQQRLQQCLTHLPNVRRELVMKAYMPGINLSQLAETMKRTPDSLYQLLCRIRQELASCIRNPKKDR